VTDEPERVLEAVRRALLGVAGNLSLATVLQELVDTAMDLAGARYAALGVPDGEGGFTHFITAGMDDDLIDSLGPLPRTHGMLGAMLESAEPFRTADIQQDPRFQGWWPRGHPDMHSFLGYPLVFQGNVAGAFYLTDKIGAPEFSDRDVEMVGEFAPHAAVLIELANLHDASRELSIGQERARIARELHDSLTQTLFGIRLALRTATDGVDEDHAARSDLLRASGLLDSAFEELRGLVWDLRPPDLEADQLSGVLRKQLLLLERTGDLVVTVALAPELDMLEADRQHQILRIVQEAVTNVARHADARHLEAAVTFRPGGSEVQDMAPQGHLVVEIRDDGTGFDPAQPSVRSRRLGLTSMHERARYLGGTLMVDSSPGAGTTVRLELPVAEPTGGARR
jgi:signal transduction histidine kinase